MLLLDFFVEVCFFLSSVKAYQCQYDSQWGYFHVEEKRKRREQEENT